MTYTAIINLAIKAIQSYANEHYGWDAKIHPEAKEKYDALMEAINILKGLKRKNKKNNDN